MKPRVIFFYIILIFYYANQLSFIIEKCQSYQNLYESNKNSFFKKCKKRAVSIVRTPYIYIYIDFDVVLLHIKVKEPVKIIDMETTLSLLIEHTILALL